MPDATAPTPPPGSEPPPLATPPARPRRLVYLGTPAVAVPPLQALVEAGFEVLAVVTRIDKRRGRGSELLPSPVKAAALDLGLPVVHRVDEVLGLGADLGVVVAFGQIIRRPVLEQLPMVNLHFSLLPRWRGAAPMERALLAGDRETGVCLMRLEEGLDTGPVYDVERVAIGDRTTGDELRATLVGVGTRMLVRNLWDGLPEPVPQDGTATYAAKLDPSEFALDWNRPAAELDRVVRLGGAWTTFRGRRLKIGAARPAATGTTDTVGAPGTIADGAVRTGDGVLVLDEVQPEGKRPMPAPDWLRGVRPGPDERLGT